MSAALRQEPPAPPLSPASLGLIARLLALYEPPGSMSLSDWAEENIVLPAGQSARPGRFRNWPYLKEVLDSIGDPTCERVTLVKSVRVGFALALNTPLATSDGWTTMGDVQIGDRLFAEDGAPCTVLAKSQVFTDHACYRLTFDDGSTIDADAGHRWQVECPVGRDYLTGQREFGRPHGAKDGESRRSATGHHTFIATTEEMALWNVGQKQTIFAVPNTEPLQTPDIDLPVDPYALGLWLGDGSTSSDRITQGVLDLETADILRSRGVPVTVEDTKNPGIKIYRLGNNIPVGPDRRFSSVGLEFRQALKRAGVLSSKHVPEVYLRASIQQRLDLLRGLMDTDGSIQTAKGFAEFTNTNINLAESVHELVVSLGMKATIKLRGSAYPRGALMRRPDGSYVMGPLKQPHLPFDLSEPIMQALPQYRVIFRPTPDRNPFALSRKANQVRPAFKPTITGRRGIVEIKPIGLIPVQCVEVDSPSHLFLAGEQMVPTHNSKCLAIAVAGMAARSPCPIIIVVPTGDDATRMMVDDIDPLFYSSPAVRNLMLPSKDDGRTTLSRRGFVGGGTMKLLPAKSPRNLRAHDAKVVLIDEADAMEVTSDGDPITLAENRAFAHEDRKVVVGSTPTVEGVSAVERRYAESDQRIYEVPCPQCGVFFEVLFQNIRWPKDEPEKAYCVCPHGCTIEENEKVAMVHAGHWRATAPEITAHRGYRINAFVSLLANAAWGKLAAEWLLAKRGGLATMQVFVNQIEGRVWRTSTGALTAGALAERAEPFGLNEIPAWVLALTAGCDVQDDRVEVTIVGWPRPPKDAATAADRRAAIGSPAVLGHSIIEGSTLDDDTWARVDELLKRRWAHPAGWSMGLDGVAIDSGGHEGRTQKVYDFCKTRMARRIYAVKGIPGARQVWERGAKTKAGYIHFNIAVDVLKTMVVDGLAQAHLDQDGNVNPHAIRLSYDLSEQWFEQATNERRMISYVHNRPVLRFQPIAPGKRVEALDCLVYAYAVRHAPEIMHIGWADRAARRGAVEQRKSIADWSASFNQG